MQPDETPRSVAVDPAVAVQIRMPAIFLIIVGCINLFAAIVFVFFGQGYNEIGAMSREEFAQWREEIKRVSPNAARQLDESEQQLLAAGFTLQEMMSIIGRGCIVWAAIAALPAVLILVGGVMMVKHKGYGLALTASILSALPVVSPLCFCLVGLGVGIWALVVLLRPEVKQAFAVGTSAALPGKEEGWGTSGDERPEPPKDEGWGASGEDRNRGPSS